MLRRLTSLLASMALLCVASGALAAVKAKDVARAKEYFAEGETHYRLGEFEDAVLAFKEAYRLFPEPTFLFNIAQAYRSLGDVKNAVFFFKSYLSDHPDPPNEVEVRALIADMERTLASPDADRDAAPGAPGDAAGGGDAATAEEAPGWPRDPVRTYGLLKTVGMVSTFAGAGLVVLGVTGLVIDASDGDARFAGLWITAATLGALGVGGGLPVWLIFQRKLRETGDRGHGTLRLVPLFAVVPGGAVGGIMGTF